MSISTDVSKDSKAASRQKSMEDFLNNADLKDLHEFIESLEKEKRLFKNSGPLLFKAAIKRLFVSKAFDMLEIHQYTISNRRQKAVISVHQGKTYFCANKKDWENRDALYEKVYKLHKNVLLEMVETLGSCGVEEVYSYAR